MAAGGKRKMVFRGLPRACWEFFSKSWPFCPHGLVVVPRGAGVLR